MIRSAAAPLLLLLLACGKQKPESEWARATWNPAHRIEVSAPSALSEWVDAHAANDVQSVWISPVRAGLRFEPLSKLKGLRALTLSGFGDSSPTEKNGTFVFPPVLSD